MSKNLEELSPLQRAVLAMKEMRAQLDAAESRNTEPIAIVSMGCRFPGGANDPDAFWENLRDGRDCMTEVPPDRWDNDRWHDPDPDTPGKICTRFGGFVDSMDQFDPGFFGITPREAVSMDPQQRILLETAWETLERAGQITDRLAGSPTGVFVGITVNEYAQIMSEAGDPDLMDAYYITGNPLNAAPGRVSYILGLNGPSLAVDTACSSSLVAVHLACQSLRARECDQALAGGVSLILSPRTSASLSRARMLSPDGRCKTFSANADGYARGEGCGLVLLRRLSDAQADQDTILAVIRGGAVNQDGPSSGFTVPNGPAQQSLIRQALSNAGVDPGQVSYVEAHGTGTSLGDPIEVGALGSVMAQGRPADKPLMIGAVKTNIGHLESAAGIASLIKVVLSLQHETIPPHLHFDPPSPHIPWKELPIKVPTRAKPWPSGNSPRIAGVSAFGASGTNAHLVVEEAPAGNSESDTWSAANRPLHVLTLSAKTEAALARSVDRHAAYLGAHPEADAGDICHSANTGRAHFNHRLSLIAASTSELSEKLSDIAQARDVAGMFKGETTGSDMPRIAFLFTGQGSQYANMARELYETQPVFQKTLDQCDEILRGLLDTSLIRLVYHSPEADALLNQTAYTQPALFALEYALARVWQSWGIRPDWVMGHSVGEYVAACVSDVFSLEHGLKLITERARLMQEMPRDGEMAAVRAHLDQIMEVISPYAEQVSVAAINGPENGVISGRGKAVDAILETLASQGIKSRKLQVSHAFHSPMTESILDAFMKAASEITYARARMKMISNLTGERVTHEIATPEYWCRHLRQPVQFAAGMRTLCQQGCDVFIEIGPKPVLLGMGKESLPPGIGLWLPSLRPNRSDWEQMLESLGALYASGITPDWHAFDQDYPRIRETLPTYPFQRQRYWIANTQQRPETQDRHTMQNTLQNHPPEPMTEIPSPAKRSGNGRQEKIDTILRGAIRNIAGIRPADLDVNANLFQIGLDSLMLVQLQQSVKKQLNVDIDMNQFVSETDTVHKITEFIDQNLGADVFAEPAESKPANPAPRQLAPQAAATPACPSYPAASGLEPLPVGDAALERIMAQQMQTMTALMNKQLDVLRQGGSLPGSSSNVRVSLDPSLEDSARSQPATEAREPVAMPAADKASPATDKDKPKVVVPGLYRSIGTDKALDQDQNQQDHLNQLIKQYNVKTPASKAYADQYRAVFAHSRSNLYRPEYKELTYLTACDHARGARFHDIDGNEYVDITMGFGVSLLGHNPQVVQDSLRAEIEQGVAIGPVSRLAGEVAALIHELTGVERVAFFNTGSEAVMVAIRLARAVTARDKIVVFSGSWHGSFDSVLASGWMENKESVTFPIAPGITHNVIKDVVVLKYGDPESLDIIRDCGQELAAVVVEPVQSRNPELQPTEFVRELRQITQETGTALIFDEMITGFRVHPGGAQVWFDVRADLVTYGKIVGGGQPVGVVAGKAEYMDAIDGGVWTFGDASLPTKTTTIIAGTFNIHPLTMAAAKAVLTHLRDQGPGLQEALNQRVRNLCEYLNRWFADQDIPFRMKYFSSLFRFVLPADSEIFFYHLLNKGVFVWEGRNCFLSTAHADEDVAFVIDAIQQTIQDMHEGGWFPHLEKMAKADDRSPHPFSGTLPLSSGQREMWFLAQSDPAASPAYNEVVRMNLRGSLDKSALKQAIRQVIVRHDILRVMSMDGEVQHIAPKLAVELPCIDFASEPDMEMRQVRAEEWMAREVRQPFDLAKGPFFRIHLLKFDKEEHIFFFVAHHLIADGWTLALFVQETAAFYSGIQKHTPVILPPSASYQAFVRWHQKEGPRAGRDYWQKVFANPLPVLELPGDHPRPAWPRYQGRRHHFRIEKEFLRQIRDFSREQGTTVFMTLLSGMSVFLSKLSGESAFMLMLPAAGQSYVGEDHLMGQCTLMLPLVMRVPGDALFEDIMIQVRQQVMDAQTHIRAMVRMSETGGDIVHMPVPTVVFNMDQAAALKFADLDTRLESQQIQFAKYDLFVNVLETDSGLMIDFDHSTELFAPERVKSWADDFIKLLQTLVRTPGIGMRELPGHTGHPSAPLRVRGFKVDLDEIRAALVRHRAVKQAAVTVLENHPEQHDAVLAAWVVFESGHHFGVRRLRSWLSRFLPENKIPKYFATPDHLPMTQEGKVDVSALRAMEIDMDTGKAEYQAPRTPAEECIASIWAEVLGIGKIGAWDNFFDLGGHSLRATQVVSRLRDQFNKDVPLRSLFETPVLADLAKLLDAAQDAVANMPAIEPVSDDSPLPLSFAQQRLWFLDQLEGPGSAYNLPQAMHISGELDLQALTLAFNDILIRHQVLRTIFSSADGQPVQVISPFSERHPEITDLSGLSEEKQKIEVRHRFEAEALRPFDLTQGPLFRVSLLKLDETEHVLLTNMHHIVSDGWSEGILLQEFARLYAQRRSGAEPSLPELPIQYADFAHWQRTWLTGQVLESQISYWKAQLAGAPALLELPTDRPRPAVQTFAGSSVPIGLESGLVEELRQLGRSAGTSLFMTLFAGFASLLHRYSGQEDLIVGSPVANRNFKETEPLIGFFVNMLALRTNLSDDPDIYTLLEQVRQMTLDAYQHQDVPFEILVETLHPKRSLSHNPIFQVSFVFQNAVAKAPHIPGLSLTSLDRPDTLESMFDLTVSLEETDQGITGFAEYNTDLFGRTFITNMLTHFRVLLEDMAAFPDKRVSELSLLTDSEKQKMALWNQTHADYPLSQPIHQVFEAQARKTPDAPALIFEKEPLSFKELNLRANQLARHLQSLGGGPGNITGICVRRSPDMVVAMLAVLKAGRAYLPLDPAYPRERLEFMIKDAQARVIITHSSLADDMDQGGDDKEYQKTLICLDRDADKIAKQSPDNMDSRTQPGDMAYVIYTSGSTGTPKGVVGTHQGMMNRFCWMWETYPFEPGEVCSQKTALSFADSIWEIFGPLLKGVRVVVIPDDAVKDAEELIRMLAHEKITRMVLVPSLLSAMLDTDNSLGTALPKLRYWTTSGEAISPDLVRRFHESSPDAILINLYGSSEVSADSTCFDTGQLGDLGCVPIGRPIANTQTWLLDKHLRQVPIGVPGELHIGGIGLGQGYLHRPELTREKFIPNPFSDDPNARLYKTGDLARFLPDGNIQYLGRTDHQVKVRGFRIELGEIEAALGEHPDIQQTLVMLREDTPGEKRLAAYIVPENKDMPPVMDLRESLKQRLPDYMVPSAFVALETMPLVPSGKVDRNALPVPDASGTPDQLYVAPRNPTEERLASIWAEVLGVDRVGIYDNFFDLGGHSLMATRIASRMREAFSVELTVRQLFVEPTIEGMGEYVDAICWVAPEPASDKETDHREEGRL